MSSSRDFVAATFADALLPILRRPVEDVIYETIDTRQIPTRTDFTEIRDLVNQLRAALGPPASEAGRTVDDGPSNGSPSGRKPAARRRLAAAWTLAARMGA